MYRSHPPSQPILYAIRCVTMVLQMLPFAHTLLSASVLGAKMSQEFLRVGGWLCQCPRVFSTKRQLFLTITLTSNTFLSSSTNNQTTTILTNYSHRNPSP